MTSPRVLIVDDEQDLRWSIRRIVERAGMQAVEADGGDNALRMIRLQSPDVVLLDVRMPGTDGREVLRRAKSLDSSLPIIMITGFGGVREAVQMLKAGAYDYVPKPFENDALILTIRNALNGNHRKQEPGRADTFPEAHLSLQERMGYGGRIQALASEVARVASTDFSVLIVGETGAGKEIVARSIHAQSRRAAHNYVAVDCGAIPDNLVESELFGHEKGAFTGADRIKPGKFEIATGGTLFFDEVSNLSPTLQTKLLRVLQERQFCRVGGNRPIEPDVHIVAATNQDLTSPADRSSFRDDLYYRLAEYVLHVPPLRERREDIVFLAKRFVRLTNDELGKNVREISDSAMRVLVNYDWPGNVRELRNIVRRAVLVADNVIDPSHFGPLESPRAKAPVTTPAGPVQLDGLSLKEIVRRNMMAVEKTVLTRTLQRTGGNKAEAARILRVDYKTIYTKVKKYGISTKGGNHDSKERARRKQ